MATLMLSQGVPMIVAGDEFLRTQKGNNNAWCQDNEISWVDWTLAEKNSGFLRFVRELIHLRKRHPVLRRRRFFKGTFHGGDAVRVPVPALTPDAPEAFPPGGPVRPGDAGLPPDTPPPATTARAGRDGGAALPLADIHWHGTEPYKPDWGSGSRTLAFVLDGRFTGREGDADYRIDADFYVAMNAWSEELKFRVPPSPTRRRWRRLIDTALPSPADFVLEGEGPYVAEGSQYAVAAFATLVLIAE
jgi:glycogen operon protein